MDKLRTLSKSSLIIKNLTQSKYSNVLMFHFSNSLSKSQPIIRKRDKEVKMGRKVAQKKLTEMLDIKPIKALEIITSHKYFYQTPTSLMSKNYEICTFNKLSKDIVLKYPYVLIDNDLSKKIEMLKMLPIKLTNSIPLIKLSVKRLNNRICVYSTETATRINDLCRIFNITHCESCEILGTKHFLFTVDLNLLENHLKRLMENGMSKEDILKDMWIFKYSEPYIKTRLQCIKENKVETVKPWMIRCPEETLYKHSKRASDNRDILGENSVAEYLSERLKCSESMAKYLIRKQSALQTKSLLKLDEMIDFLYRHGFTPSQICRIPKVLLHSTKTAENRLKELAALGNKPDNLYVLTKSQRQYMQYIESLIKAKSKPKII